MDRFQKDQEKSTKEPPKKKAGETSSASARVQNSIGLLQHKIDHTIDKFVGTGVDAPELLLVPDDLQTSDPSLMSEISSGHFGLDGMFIELLDGDVSIFEHPELDDSYNRVLHGFGWLRDLRARDDFEAQNEAQKLVFQWIGLVWQPGRCGL